MTVIKTKNNSNAVPAATALKQGELAVDVAQGRLWVGEVDDTSITEIVGGAIGSGTDDQTLRWNNGAWEATSDLVVDDAGNVGIGTAGPRAKLEVFDASLTSFTGTTQGAIRLKGGQTNGEFACFDFGSTLQSQPFARIGMEVTSSGSVLHFGTSNNYGSGITNDAMVITPGGNVGIGISPVARLNIDGGVLDPTVSPQVNATLIAASDNTPGAGQIGGSIVFSRADGLTFGSCAINAYQEDVNAPRLGMDFWVHDSFSGSAPMSRAMRITSAGNVGIGTATPRDAVETTRAGAVFHSFAQTGVGYYAIGMLAGENALVFGQGVGASSEHMRIDQFGNLLVGKTVAGEAGIGVYLENANGRVWGTSSNTAPFQSVLVQGSGSVFQARVNNSSQTAGQIATNGSALSFAAGSDITLKDNVQDMGGELASVLALRPVDYTLKSNGQNYSGFIAQEVQDVWPHKVSVNDDDGLLMLSDMGDTTARLVKAIQEQQEQIDELRALIGA